MLPHTAQWGGRHRSRSWDQSDVMGGNALSSAWQELKVAQASATKRPSSMSTNGDKGSHTAS